MTAPSKLRIFWSPGDDETTPTMVSAATPVGALFHATPRHGQRVEYVRADIAADLLALVDAAQALVDYIDRGDEEEDFDETPLRAALETITKAKKGIDG